MIELTQNQVKKQPKLQWMDLDDVYQPKCDDIKSCDLSFESTHDIESERLDFETGFESDSESDDPSAAEMEFVFKPQVYCWSEVKDILIVGMYQNRDKTVSLCRPDLYSSIGVKSLIIMAWS